MSGVAAAVAGGAIIGGIGGALISSHAAGDAADKQSAAANQASQLQYQQYEQQRSDQAPWRAAGQQALGQMQDPYFQKNFSMSDFQADPGYAFRLQEGQKALERSAAARGGLQSGGTLKGITQYGQDMASGEYQNAYNRFTNNQSNRFNRLASLAGTGQTANAQLGQAGMNMANNVGNNVMGAANAAGAAGMASANVWGNTLSGIGSGAGNTWMQYQMMNRMFPQQQPMNPGIPSAAPSSAGNEYFPIA